MDTGMEKPLVDVGRTSIHGPPFAGASTMTRTVVARVVPPFVPRTVMSYVPGVGEPGRLIVTRATAPVASPGASGLTLAFAPGGKVEPTTEIPTDPPKPPRRASQISKLGESPAAAIRVWGVAPSR